MYARNLKVYFASQSRNVHDIVPQTYIITVGEHTSDYTEFLKHIRALEARVCVHFLQYDDILRFLYRKRTGMVKGVKG